MIEKEISSHLRKCSTTGSGSVEISLLVFWLIIHLLQPRKNILSWRSFPVRIEAALILLLCISLKIQPFFINILGNFFNISKTVSYVGIFLIILDIRETFSYNRCFLDENSKVLFLLSENKP